MSPLKSAQTGNAVKTLKKDGRIYIKAEMVVYDTLVEDVVYHVGYFLYVVAGRFYCVLTFHLHYSQLGWEGGGGHVLR